MQSQIVEILKEAVYAPSGDNSQPWRFVLNGHTLDIYSTPEKDNPIFNFRQRGTYLAHGALVENIVVAASVRNLKAVVKWFPYEQEENCTASINFFYSNEVFSDLQPFIKKRSTNRKPYLVRKLSENEKKNLERVFLNQRPNFFLVEEKNRINKIGAAVSVNEIIMLTNRELHDFFYSDVRWTTRSEKKHKTGLYLKTMELQPPQALVFKLLQNWNLAKILTKLGLVDFIARENSKIYQSVSAFCGIIVNGEKEEYLEAGRLMQRLWLTAVKNNLSMHPVSGIIYLAQPLLINQKTNFTTHQEKQIMEAYKVILQNVGNPGGSIAMMFRIGESSPSSGFSSRLEPSIEIK